MTSRQILAYWPSTVQRTFLRWWNKRLERHYLMCADVEARRRDEADANVTYYHKQAVIARSNARK